MCGGSSNLIMGVGGASHPRLITGGVSNAVRWDEGCKKITFGLLLPTLKNVGVK